MRYPRSTTKLPSCGGFNSSVEDFGSFRRLTMKRRRDAFSPNFPVGRVGLVELARVVVAKRL